MANRKNILICRGVNTPNLNCTGTKLDTDFFDSWSQWDGYKVCFCKNCLNKIYDNYLKKSNSEKVALYYTCLQINVPFMKEVYKSCIKYDKNGFQQKVTINKYITELTKNYSIKKDIWNDFSVTDINLLEEDKVSNVDKEKMDSLEDKWGIQDDIKDYDFLENTFERYTQEVEFVNSQQEDLYRDLCRDRLLLRKINDNRYGGEETIDKVQNRISKTMSILKIDQFSAKQKKTDIERIIEKQIWEIENTEPSEVVDKNEYKDFLDINKSWGKSILRSVKNLLVGSKEYPHITRESSKFDE